MYRGTRTRHENEARREIIVNGVKLEVVAVEVGSGKWELSIENELGITSVWLEFFATAASALDAGMKAIELEGADPFTDTDGFEYLLEDKDV